MQIHHRTRLESLEDQAMDDGFRAYNAEQGQSSARIPLALAAYDEGELVGALDGYLFFGYLTVSRLWVAPHARATGIGSRLLAEAEAKAREAQCVGSTLSTYDFQARPFYEKQGYQVFGVLPDNPRGHARFFMHKRLAD